MNDHKIIEKKLGKLLADSFKNDSYNVKIEDPWKTSSQTYYIDAGIYKDDIPLAVIEVKTKLGHRYPDERIINQLKTCMEVAVVRYGILTDGEIFYILNDVYEDSNLTHISFSELTNLLLNPVEYEVSEEIKSTLITCLNEVARELFANNEGLIRFRTEIKTQCIGFDGQTNTYYIKDRSENVEIGYENEVFSKMFGEQSRRRICRYTSLRTLFIMLNNQSFRMCGLAGMN